MTKEEILNALEGLKDFVNHVGKQSIDSIKAGVRGLAEPPVVPAEAYYAPEPVADTEEVHLTEKMSPEEEAEVFEPKNVVKKKVVPHGTKKKR